MSPRSRFGLRALVAASGLACAPALAQVSPISPVSRSTPIPRSAPGAPGAPTTASAATASSTPTAPNATLRQDAPEPAPPQPVDAHADGHAAMLETLREIEREMHALDGYLWSRATPSGPPQPTRVREALLEAKRRVDREVELIDRVFELAKHDHGEGGK
ncbi:MAG: hypothetical protein IT459_17110 [Planctomycetes bacterium]|nr:hypothetical protein [Planctomycetota bacterium]